MTIKSTHKSIAGFFEGQIRSGVTGFNLTIYNLSRDIYHKKYNHKTTNDVKIVICDTHLDLTPLSRSYFIHKSLDKNAI